MRTPALLSLMLTCCGAAFAQRVQNHDIYFLFGFNTTSSRVIPGSDVVMNGKTSFASSVGYGYEVVQTRAGSLWLDLSFGTFVVNGFTKASIPGSFLNDIEAYTVGGRYMIPVHPRISPYGLIGAGVGRLFTPTIKSGPSPFVASDPAWRGVLNVGGGVDVRLTERVSIRVELKDLVTGRGLSGATGPHHPIALFGIATHF